MKILLVYPRFADALWAYKHALKFICKRASSPPLGLLTVAAMLPESWTKKLVDMNAADLSDEAIQWADYVFLGAMLAQQASAMEVVARCKGLATRIVGGGPLFSVPLHNKFRTTGNSFFFITPTYNRGVRLA